MTKVLYYSVMGLAGLTLAYFAVDLIVWVVYWMVNVI